VLRDERASPRAGGRVRDLGAQSGQHNHRGYAIIAERVIAGVQVGLGSVNVLVPTVSGSISCSTPFPRLGPLKDRNLLASTRGASEG